MMMMMMMMMMRPEGRSLLVESLGQPGWGQKKAVSDSESGSQHPERFIQETAIEYL